jgi:hypothetical protein
MFPTSTPAGSITIRTLPISAGAGSVRLAAGAPGTASTRATEGRGDSARFGASRRWVMSQVQACHTAGTVGLCLTRAAVRKDLPVPLVAGVGVAGRCFGWDRRGGPNTAAAVAGMIRCRPLARSRDLVAARVLRDLGGVGRVTRRAAASGLRPGMGLVGQRVIRVVGRGSRGVAG